MINKIAKEIVDKAYGKPVNVKNKKLYHTSNPINRDSILKKGLVPKRGEQLYDKKNISYKPAIYASFKVWDSTYDDDVWEIDTSKINNEWFVDENLPKKAVVTFSKISRQALKLIHEGTGESE